MSETATTQDAGDDLLPEDGVVNDDGQGDEADAGLEGDLRDGDDDQSSEDDETEEIEIEGVKYALPKALKPALLMQADYTRKTQALAEQARGVDELRDKLSASLSEVAEADEAIVDTRAAVKAIDSQAAQLKATIADIEHRLAHTDLRALAEIQNGEALYRQAEQELRQYKLLQDKLGEDRTKLANDLDGKVKARDETRKNLAIEQQQVTVKRFEERDAVLKAEFPKWSEEFPVLQSFAARAFGIKPQDVAATSDPTLLKVLRYAKLGFEAEQRDATTKKVAARIQPAVSGGAKPVTKVGGSSTPRTDPNRMSTDAWMKHRRDQIAKTKGRR